MQRASEPGREAVFYATSLLFGMAGLRVVQHVLTEDLEGIEPKFLSLALYGVVSWMVIGRKTWARFLMMITFTNALGSFFQNLSNFFQFLLEAQDLSWLQPEHFGALLMGLTYTTSFVLISFGPGVGAYFNGGVASSEAEVE
ncbi:MAG: hypothetical protein ACYS26_06395 [Planctomycetota bacterium]|jgi:ABC-type enterochelin transport system permease subunit